MSTTTFGVNECTHSWGIVDPTEQDRECLDKRFLEYYRVIIINSNQCARCKARRMKVNYESKKDSRHTGWSDWFMVKPTNDPVSMNLPPIPGLSEAPKVWSSDPPATHSGAYNVLARISVLESELAKAHLTIATLNKSLLERDADVAHLESYKEAAKKEVVRACNAEKEFYGQALFLKQENDEIMEQNVNVFNSWQSAEKMIVELKADIRMWKSKLDQALEQLAECRRRLAEREGKTLAEQARAKLTQEEVNALFAHYNQLEKDRKEGKV